MKFRMAISVVVASMLALTYTSGVAGQGQGKGGGGSMDRVQQVDRDRSYDRDRTYDRDRIQDRDRVDAPDQDRDQDRDRDRIHLRDPMSLGDKEIYGSEFMTDAERNQYRKQLAKAKTVKARKKIQAQHEERMQKRALNQGKDLVPPGQGPVYGGEFMSVEERNQYREQLRLIDSDQERMQFQAQHREKMTQRAKALEREIEEAE